MWSQKNNGKEWSKLDEDLNKLPEVTQWGLENSLSNDNHLQPKNASLKQFPTQPVWNLLTQERVRGVGSYTDNAGSVREISYWHEREYIS